MWAAFKLLRLYSRNLTRIAIALTDIAALYKLELASRGIVPLDPNVRDEVEVSYGYMEDRDQL